MSAKTAKVSLTVVVLATAFGVLLYSSLGESMQYYKYTDEVMASPAEWQGKPLQVHGFVVPGSIARKPDTLEYRFDMQRNGKVMRAFYTGVVPDTFKDDSEVVLTGRLSNDDSKTEFHATEMTAKCPSKYEEAPAGPGADSKPSISGQTGGE
jgi:cytochrome c-type biogenesis protein CcmE